MKKNYIELEKKERKYISLQKSDNSFRAVKFDNYFRINDSIPCGCLMIEICFLATQSGKILTPIVNNYFDCYDQIYDMGQYEEYKKGLLLRIKLDMEEKKIENNELLEACLR